MYAEVASLEARLGKVDENPGLAEIRLGLGGNHAGGQNQILKPFDRMSGNRAPECHLYGV
jgi:hypothetical protein